MAVRNHSVDSVRPVDWTGDQLRILDQRHLPGQEVYIDCSSVTDITAAIKNMAVRGAPAIGITAAYGVVLAARNAWQQSQNNWKTFIQEDLFLLAQSRPTAINLHWALQRMQSLFPDIVGDPHNVLVREAIAIHEEDIAANKCMGKLGAACIADADQVLTHCNTGSLATGGYGTALGVIRTAWQAGSLKMVYASETRPWLQGARLTAWELLQDRIPVTLIADNAANLLLSKGRVKWVIVGADRIVANGDVANKIGTYNLAITARHHGAGLMVVAPTSTFDLETATGAEIPIEDRGPAEIEKIGGIQIAPVGISVWNPVFDVTPAQLIDVIVTEKGVIHKPDKLKIAALFR